MGDCGRAARSRRNLLIGPVAALSGSSRVCSAARSLESQPQAARLLSCGTAKTALRACWAAESLLLRLRRLARRGIAQAAGGGPGGGRSRGGSSGAAAAATAAAAAAVTAE
eukprot:scaffold47238_cov72-Phaeocystis_antarctica.AAC.4